MRSFRCVREIRVEANGIAVVTAEVGGIPEALGIDAGILIPCGDPQTLGKALISLLVDAELKRSIGSAAREKRLRAYAAELVMEQISGRYAELGLSRPAVCAESVRKKNVWNSRLPVEKRRRRLRAS